MSEESTSASGLSSREAQEFHSLYMMGFIGFTLDVVVNAAKELYFFAIGSVV